MDDKESVAWWLMNFGMRRVKSNEWFHHPEYRYLHVRHPHNLEYFDEHFPYIEYSLNQKGLDFLQEK